MANAFYRNTSSSGKKKSDRERRQSGFTASEEAAELAAAESSSEEPTPRRRNRVEPEEGECAEGGFAWTARITPSALVTASVLSLVLLSFSFLPGVIVGRGTMPLPQALQLEKLLAEETTKKNDEARILQKEELHFMTSLKDEDGEGVLSASREDSPKAKPAAKAEAPRKKVEKKAEAKAEKKEPRQTLYDYVLRVAAFKEAEPAKRLVEKLGKAGMKARYAPARTSSGYWHYVQVLMRGTVADLQVMRRKLDSFRLHDAIVISRKEVQEKKKPSEPAKPKLIRNSERTDLFENYKKVMDDEDDYNFGEPEKVKRGILRRNKNVEPEFTQQNTEAEQKNEIELQAEAAVGAVFEDVVK